MTLHFFFFTRFFSYFLFFFLPLLESKSLCHTAVEENRAIVNTEARVHLLLHGGIHSQGIFPSFRRSPRSRFLFTSALICSKTESASFTLLFV